MKPTKEQPQGRGAAPAHAPLIGFGRLLDEPCTDGLQQESDSARAGSAAGGARPLRLLVVDDDKHVADAMALLLELQGYEVAVAYRGAEAIELAERLEPRVVFLDIGMTGMDGFETARRLRAAEPDSRRRRLIAVSGYGDPPFLQACRQAGMDHHLVKPVSRQMLTQALEGLD